MKFIITVLALAGCILAGLAAPSTEPQVEAIEDTKESLLSPDTTSALIEASEAIEDTNRAKKSSSPKTICFEVKDVQGRSFLQCSESVDSEPEGTSLSSYHSPAPAPSYGSPSYGSSSSYSAPSYRVSAKHFNKLTKK